MNTISRKKLAIGLFTVFLGAWQLPAHALPKAAEHEDAPVFIAADVAKPRVSSKPARKDVQKKAPPAAKAKPHNPPPAPKKAKTSADKK